MNFIEYVQENSEGLVFIDRLRKAIKDFCSKGIREEIEDVTDEDVDKMYLMLEHNFFVGITSDDSEWDINTIKVDEVQFLINSNIGLFSLMRGIDKNRRQSYSETLWDVIYNVFSSTSEEEDNKLFKSSGLIKRVYDTISMIECGEDGYSYDLFTDDELQQCLSDIYKVMIEDKIEF